MYRPKVNKLKVETDTRKPAWSIPKRGKKQLKSFNTRSCGAAFVTFVLLLYVGNLLPITPNTNKDGSKPITTKSKPSHLSHEFAVSKSSTLTEENNRSTESYGKSTGGSQKKPHPFLDKGDPQHHGTIKSINILGERNSGTTWMFEHLSLCFNHSIPVRRRLKRYKHWFQDENIPIEEIVDGTLVVAIFRNVFDWTRAMMATPHNAPEHIGLRWKEFLTKKWTMERVGLDLNVTEEQKNDPLFCQDGFLYKDVISCHRSPYPKKYFKRKRFSEDKPIYEMRPDGTGEPFNNILEMRAAKIRNTLTTKDYEGVKDLWLFHYEDLLEYGTKELIHSIEEMTGFKAKCDFSPSQKRKKRQVPYDMYHYLEKGVDWDAEALIEYHK